MLIAEGKRESNHRDDHEKRDNRQDDALGFLFHLDIIPNSLYAPCVSIHTDAEFAPGQAVRWNMRYIGERPELRRLWYELVHRIGISPMRVAHVRPVPCSCGRKRQHSAACKVARAPHPTQAAIEGVTSFGPINGPYFSGALLECASLPTFSGSLAA